MSQSMQHRATHTMSFSEHTQSTKRENSEKMFEINISTQVGNPPVQHFVSSLLGAAIHFFFIPAKLSGTHFHQHNHHHYCHHHQHHQQHHHHHHKHHHRQFHHYNINMKSTNINIYNITSIFILRGIKYTYPAEVIQT